MIKAICRAAVGFNCALFIVTSAFAATPSNPSHVEDLTIGLGDFGPFFIEESRSGLFTDLISEVFSLLPQYRVNYRFGMSNFRLRHDLNTGVIDGAANIFAKEDVNGCVSEPFFRFTDMAMTLKRRKITVNSIQDLSQYSVVTYQGMTEFWSDVLGDQLENKQGYTELPNMESQSKMLAAGRRDVSIGDLYIFLYSVNNWSNGHLSPESFDFHPIFPVNYTHMGFNDSAVCQAFNDAFHTVKDNGTYDKVYFDYLERLGLSEENVRRIRDAR